MPPDALISLFWLPPALGAMPNETLYAHMNKNVGLWRLLTVRIPGYIITVVYMMYFLEQNIYWFGKNVSYQEPIANCSLTTLLAVLLQTPSSLVRNCPFSSGSLESGFSSYENRRRERGGRKEEYRVVSQKNLP